MQRTTTWNSTPHLARCGMTMDVGKNPEFGTIWPWWFLCRPGEDLRAFIAAAELSEAPLQWPLGWANVCQWIKMINHSIFYSSFYLILLERLDHNDHGYGIEKWTAENLQNRTGSRAMENSTLKLTDPCVLVDVIRIQVYYMAYSDTGWTRNYHLLL